MSITTYSELKTAIANWLNRDDLTAVIPDFVSLVEADLNRKLRHYKMIERVDATLDSRYVQLPADWLETMRFAITSGNTFRLQAISVDVMLEYREENRDQAGRPKYYAHIGEAIEVFPTPDAEYGMQLTYYQDCLLYTSPSPRDGLLSRMPSSA